MHDDPQAAVLNRYSRGAAVVESELCCPADYNPEYLRIIPQEIMDKDYGCGDPTRYVRRGETVLDLGSGSGKICYMLAQVVGPEGCVIGVDFNEDMLALAERYRHQIGEILGYHNTDFRKGLIQNLRRDLRQMDIWLAQNPPRTSRELLELEARVREQERTKPLIGDESADAVVSNCVLNLVRSEDKPAMFDEIYRVLRTGGRAIISDIVSDEDVPAPLQSDPVLWSGCVSGALRDERFLQSFIDAGFHGVEILRWASEPWRVIDGIEFRSITVAARKGKAGPCLERNQAVIYKGPWSAVEDDDHHRLLRGQRSAVCDKTFNLYRSGSYARDLILLEPGEPVALAAARPFDCSRPTFRHPRELKDRGYRVAERGHTSCCGTSDSCC